MTLQKAKEGGSSYPFLRPFEAELSKKGEVIAEPRIIKTKFKDEQAVVEVKLAKIPKAEDYKPYKMSDEAKRLEDPVRTWVMNGKSLNFYIDKFGDQESEWVGKTVEWQVENQIVSGRKTEVIYSKGSI